MPGWTSWALDAAEWMIGECLKNPIHAGETEATSESSEGTPSPSSATYQQGVSSIGKSSIYYEKVGATEFLDISFNGMVGGANTFDGTLQRSGLGASTTYKFVKSNVNSNSFISWRSGSFNDSDKKKNYDYDTGTLYAGYTFSAGSCYYKDNSGNQQTATFHPVMISTSQNQIPVYYSTLTQAVAVASVLGYYYSENSFYSNSPEYISNHTLNSVSNNYFNPVNVSVDVVNAYIPAGTNVNVTNYQDYSQYGYYVNNNGDVDIDMNTLAAYLNGTLKAQLEAAYIEFYTRFPEFGVAVTDPDINYYDPFDDGTQDPTEDTSGGQLQPFSIDYDEILGERELESILAESRYILDTTPYEIASIDYNQAVSEPYAILKQNSQLPAEVAGSISKVYSIAEDVIPADIMKVYGFIAFLSVGMWFILRK